MGGCKVAVSLFLPVTRSPRHLLMRSITSIVDDVQKHAAQILRHNFESTNRAIILFFNGAIERSIIRAQAVIREIHGFVQQMIDIYWLALAERGEFLLRHQLLLCGFQVGAGFGQFLVWNSKLRGFF